MHMTMKSLAVMKKTKSKTLYEHVHKSAHVKLARALTLQIQSANVPASFIHLLAHPYTSPDVWIYPLGPSSDLESYVQETARVSRDCCISHVTLLETGNILVQ